MMKRLLCLLALCLFSLPTFGDEYYVLQADGVTVKQTCPKSCDCGCQNGERCLCTAGTAGTSAADASTEYTAHIADSIVSYTDGGVTYRQVCGPTGCQWVAMQAAPIVTVGASFGATSTAVTAYTYADVSTGADVSYVSAGRGRRHRLIAVLCPRLAAAHQARVANGTALIAPACPPQSFGTPVQLAFPMPAGPVAAPVQVPLTAAQKTMALQRGQWMQLIFKYGFDVVQLMPELIPLVTTHGWQVLANPAVDAWILQAIFALNHGQPVPPVPAI